MALTIAQVMEGIAAAIQDENDTAFQPGKSIPSGRVLASLFGASLMTVQKAVRQLVDDGVLVKGRGGFEVRAEPIGKSRAFHRLPEDDVYVDVMDYWYLRGIVVALAVYFFPERLPDVADLRRQIESEGDADEKHIEAAAVERRYRLIEELVNRYEAVVDTQFVVDLLQRVRSHVRKRGEAKALEAFVPQFATTWFWTKRTLAELCQEIERARQDPPDYRLIRCDAIAGLVRDLFYKSATIEFQEDRKRRSEMVAILSKSAREHYKRRPRRGWSVAELAGELRDRIVTGKAPWVPGSVAPSGRALEQEFKVSRTTMQAARHELVEYGWLVGEGTRLRVGPAALWVDREEFAATPFNKGQREFDVLFKLAAEIAFVIQLRLADLYGHQRELLPELLSVASPSADVAMLFREAVVPGRVSWGAVERVYGLMAFEARAPLLREALVHLLHFLGDRLEILMDAGGVAFTMSVGGTGRELAERFEFTPNYLFGENEGPRRRLTRLDDIGRNLVELLRRIYDEAEAAERALTTPPDDA